MSSSGKVIRIPLQVASAAPVAPEKQGETADPVLEEQLHAAGAFAKASSNIAELLEYINRVLGYVGYKDSTDRIIPDANFKLPLLYLEKMLGTATWPDFHKIRERSENQGATVPNGFIKEGPKTGTLTVSADEMEATKFKEACQNAVECMETWLLEEHKSLNKYETPTPWNDYRFQFHLIHNARQALEDWFVVLWTLLEMQDDTASIKSVETDNSGDDEGGARSTKRSSRRSSLSGSHRLSSNVAGTTNHDSTETKSTGAPAAPVDDWVVVDGPL